MIQLEVMDNRLNRALDQLAKDRDFEAVADALRERAALASELGPRARGIQSRLEFGFRVLSNAVRSGSFSHVEFREFKANVTRLRLVQAHDWNERQQPFGLGASHLERLEHHAALNLKSQQRRRITLEN